MKRQTGFSAAEIDLTCDRTVFPPLFICFVSLSRILSDVLALSVLLFFSNSNFWWVYQLYQIRKDTVRKTSQIL